MTPWNLTFLGVAYFLKKPKLWVAPLCTTLFIFGVMIFSFGWLSYIFWPNGNLTFGKYVLAMFVAIAKSSFIILLIWTFIFPIVLNFGFESMIKKILKGEGRVFESKGFFFPVVESFSMIFINFGARIFWPILVLLSIFIFPFITIFLAQLAVGHIAVLDAASLTYTIQGIKKEGQKLSFQKEKRAFLLAGLVSGCIGFFVLPTVIFWIFWVPGIYVGTTLYIIDQYS